jgi:hypothetical protein
MKERERIVVSGLFVLMLIFWLGFAVHGSALTGQFWGRRAGRLLGFVDAVAAGLFGGELEF